MSDEQPPFRIESPTKIWLSAEARSMAVINGMTDIQMARHLLEQHRQREAGLIQGES